MPRCQVYVSWCKAKSLCQRGKDQSINTKTKKNVIGEECVGWKFEMTKTFSDK